MRLRGDGVAPPERLATFRILLGGFVTAYLAVRVGVFLELGNRSANRFDPVGIFRLIGEPLDRAVNSLVVVAALTLGIAFAVGWCFRLTGPLFALVLLVVTSHRSSWGQMLHFENLMVLHTFVVALAPSADAWSVDARRSRAMTTRIDRRAEDRYGFPLLVASVIVVATYVVAGVAKLRYGGLNWVAGDTLRNHVAYSAARLELLGGWASPAARWAVESAWLLPPLAAVALLIELAAPIALLGGRWRTGWVAAAWLMHVGIYLLMLVGFPSPLFLIAFAPLFPLERLALVVRTRIGELRLTPAPE